MNIPKRAIELAVEGGWRGTIVEREDGGRVTVFGSQKEYHSAVALDPLFFQALGKALGWPIEIKNSMHRYKILGEYKPWWQYHAHRFYDLVLTGGDTEAYWNTLLVSKE